MNRLPIYKRDYSKFDKEALISELDAINWHEVLSTNGDNTDVTQFFNHFIHTLMTVSIGMLLFGNCLGKKPNHFVNPGLLLASKYPLRLRINYIKNTLNLEVFIILQNTSTMNRNKISQLLRTCKQDYYQKYFQVNNKNVKNILCGIKELINLNTRSSNPSLKILIDNSTIKDPKAIATAFNQYFSNIGRKLADSIPTADIKPEDFLGRQQFNSFYLSPVTSTEIEDIISALNPSKATGPFSITTYLLKIF